jgi:hypothetical protein
VVFFLLCFNAFLAFREDMKARASVEALKQKLQLSARVLRYVTAPFGYFLLPSPCIHFPPV